MYKLKTLIIVLTLGLTLPMTAQGNGLDSMAVAPDEEQAASLDSLTEATMKKRAKEKVGQFCNYVSFIASKKRSRTTRLYYVEQAYKLFLNHGRALFDEDNPKEMIRDSVIMQVTSIKSAKPRNIYLRAYLPRMADLKYPNVSVTSTDVAEMKVSNLQKLGDGLYTCTVYFYQYFVGATRDNHVLYRDKTNKRVQVFIAEDRTEDGTEYIVMLGDIFADAAEPF